MTTKTAEKPAVLAANPREVYFAVRNLNSYYGDSYIVQDVSFDVAEGEIIALLGRNGAGKTSTLRTIARAGSPHLRSGEIWLQGTAVHEMESYQAANLGIQLVPEDRRIIPGMTVEENLDLAASRVTPDGLTSRSMSCSRASRSAAARKAPPCRAVSSRCWPLPARWCET
jgi:branched-chain amino acid transport system ATP-binding protein